MNAAGLAVAGMALAVSLVSFVVNYRAAQSAERHGRMPVLIPQSPIPPDRITIRNIGNGPALNVVIAHARDDLARRDALDVDLSDAAHRAMWHDLRHLEPIEPGGSRSYRWAFEEAVGLTYTDALGAPYTTLAGPRGTRVAEGRAMPRQALAGMEQPEGA